MGLVRYLAGAALTVGGLFTVAWAAVRILTAVVDHG
jgi:hypothetical protein